MKSRIASLSPGTEFAVVTLGAFGLSILGSVMSVAFYFGRPVVSTTELYQTILYEIVTLSVLAWFLQQRGWTLSKLSERPALSDLPIGIGLGVAGLLIYYAVWALTVFSLPATMKSAASMTMVSGRLGLGVVAAISVVNPIFEEAFLCGYILTAMKAARSPTAAVNVSVAIRMLCHLYQGPVGLWIIPLGLMLAWFYARTRRLWPVVIAHMLLDLVGLVPYL